MPCNEVEGAVVLLNGIVKTVGLVDDGPICMEDLVDVSHRVEEISGVGQAVATDRT